MYAALTPLLPAYAERFDLSKTGAGVLAGVYAAGAMLGAAPSAWLAARAGARRTLLAGLALKTLAGLGFAFGQTIVVLDATRFLLGLGAACSWAGGMGWLVATTPAARRGRTIGGAMGAAVVGFLLGPVLGAVARVTGPEVPFGAVGVLAAVLGLCAARLPPPPRAPAARGRLAPALRDPRIRVGAWLVTANALAIGAVEVLAPLRLDALGAGGLVIGATFLGAAAVEGGVQLAVGRATDRWGRGAPIRIALAGLVGALLLLPLPQALLPLILAVTLAWIACGALNTPAMTLVSDGVDGRRLDQSLGFATTYFAWAGGQVVGAVAGGLVAARTSDAVVYVALAALCAVTYAAVARRDAPALRRAAAGTPSR
jgi:MFS family permease